MLNKIITEKLKSEQYGDKEYSNVEHLIINKLFEQPYFQSMKKPALYTNGKDILSFYKDDFSNENFLDSDWLELGHYIYRSDEHKQMTNIYELLLTAEKVEDLAGKFTEDDIFLVNKTFPSMRDGSYKSLFSIVVFMDKLKQDENFQLNYSETYGGLQLQTDIEQFVVGDKFRFSSAADCPLQKHLTHNKSDINQNTMTDESIGYLLRTENKTIQSIFQNKFFNNDGNMGKFDDLSAILCNPNIREGSNIGILFDETINGYQKLLKLYNKEAFKTTKANIINDLEFKLDSPMLDNFENKYQVIIDDVVSEVMKTLPQLNMDRNQESIVIEKENINYEDFYNRQSFKSFGISIRSFFNYDSGLINSACFTYFNRALGVENAALMESHQLTFSANHELYHCSNGIESLLLVKGRCLKDHQENEVPLIMIENLITPNNNVNQTIYLLNNYINEAGKNGNKVLINYLSSRGSDFLGEVIKGVETNSNLIVSRNRKVEASMNNLKYIMGRTTKLTNEHDRLDFIVEQLTTHTEEIKIAQLRDDIETYQPKRKSGQLKLN